MVEHQTPESKKSDREREDQGDRQRRSPGLSMPCSLRRTWRFFRSAVHSPTSSVARKHAERGESAGCHAGTGPYALCNKVGHHAGAGPVGALSLTGLGPGPRRPGCCPKTSRPTTNSTLICELSCRARYAGKIAPCVSCTDNGRILLANQLQSSGSTFSCVSFPSFFAFQEGMWDTQISALPSSPTVSGPLFELGVSAKAGLETLVERPVRIF